MNNEPVAWMYQDDESRSVAFYRDTLPCGAVPLYTHPAKTQADIEYEADKAYWRTRTLTDEEILEVEQQVNKELEAKGHGIMWFDDGIYVFAKAILRKAQEK